MDPYLVDTHWLKKISNQDTLIQILIKNSGNSDWRQLISFQPIKSKYKPWNKQKINQCISWPYFTPWEYNQSQESITIKNIWLKKK